MVSAVAAPLSRARNAKMPASAWRGATNASTITHQRAGLRQRYPLQLERGEQDGADAEREETERQAASYRPQHDPSHRLGRKFTPHAIAMTIRARTARPSDATISIFLTFYIEVRDRTSSQLAGA
jgi:hypothetical protein